MTLINANQLADICTNVVELHYGEKGYNMSRCITDVYSDKCMTTSQMFTELNYKTPIFEDDHQF